jgi:hypothetical protein
MLAMEPPGSSQWMDRVEPELEAGAVLPGRGPDWLRWWAADTRTSTKPCRLQLADPAQPSLELGTGRRRAAACAVAVMKPVRCVPSTDADQVPPVAASTHTIRLPSRPRSAANVARTFGTS